MDNSNKKKNVLITGASRGIGYYTAELLAKNNFCVLAGVRKQEDFDKLKHLNKNIFPVFVDVTDENLINSAYEYINDNFKELYAVINNAGIAIVEPLETILQEDLKKQFDINTFAPIKIIQKFSPLIKKGKIINICSVAADLDLPFGSTYCASKKALEMLISAYSKEISNKDLKFITIKPGIIKTEIWHKNPEKFKNTPYYHILNIIYYFMKKFSQSAQTPEKISLKLLKILKSKSNKETYYFGSDIFLIKQSNWLVKYFAKPALKYVRKRFN